MASSATSFDYQLFSSLHYSPTLLLSTENTKVCGHPSPFYLVPYHRDRMAAAAEHFAWSDAVEKLKDLDGFIKACEDAVTNYRLSENKTNDESLALKLRTLLTSSGVLTVEATLINAVPRSSLFPTSLALETFSIPPTIYTIHIDPVPTPPSSFTTFKTTSRKDYDASRLRCEITAYTQPDEVLLWSDDDELIMEGSLTNVYFRRAGSWVTPNCGTAGAGGTGGTVRRWLIEKGLVKVADVAKDDVKDGEGVWISNGVRGLIHGKVVMTK